MMCQKCKRYFPHRQGRFCGTCHPSQLERAKAREWKCQQCGAGGVYMSCDTCGWIDAEELEPIKRKEPMKANCNTCGTACTRAGNMKRSEWCECEDYTRKYKMPLNRSELECKLRVAQDALKEMIGILEENRAERAGTVQPGGGNMHEAMLLTKWKIAAGMIEP